ncbi:FAD-dependent oxidoreductase [Desulfobulbus alkaliphilus]|uniref:FAD-dependent oxidoreductase n=1 Tax=Desulfobulbus alkaliphilus TaxID=869814 RepID=UPI001964F6B6|nr:FAD-dependent oxidoreductase [Desulfobulbus alkaliphilus]MBM9537516.1 FAD-dependent oxidoreductase [Desulfobulbus alkaliphilus]
MKRQKERLYKVIVAGATPEGIAATNKLGELGIPVTLVESAPDLDRKLAAEEYRLPSGLTFNYAHRPGLIRIARNSSIRTLLPAKISSIKHTHQGFSVRIDQEQTFIDSDRCALCGKCVAVCPVTQPETGKALHFHARTSLPGRPYIDKRNQPLCQENCPLGVNAQGYIALASQGRYEEALALIRKDNILPGICGRVCTHPCEEACRRGGIDDPVAIREIKRFLADYENSDPSRQATAVQTLLADIEPTRREKVAIIGSGPAGLAAAADLARRGYRVTVFEKEAEPGGLLRYGIGRHRLPRAILDREIKYIEQMGVTFVTNHPIDLSRDLQRMSQDHDRVLISTGTWYDRQMGVPGENLAGVEGCLNFLARSQWEDLNRMEGKVAVIGDGNSAFDLARTLARMGAEVSILSWFDLDRIPADPIEVREALEEGVTIIDATQVIAFQGENNRLARLQCMPTVPGPADEKGVAWPVVTEGSQPFTLDVQRAFVAIGQVGGYNADSFNGLLAVSDRGFIVTDDNQRTTLSKVYAGGDTVSGPTSVVQAMAAGREAARSIHADLTGRECPVPISRPTTRDFPAIPETLTPLHRTPVAERPAQERRKDFDEVIMGFNAQQVSTEAGRCLQCGVCSECLQCVAACGALKAIDHHQEKEEIVEHCGAVIVADPSLAPSGIKGDDIIRAYGPKAARPDVNDMVVRGFDAAARAMLLLGGASRKTKGHGLAFTVPDAVLSPEIRIGVFACRCNDALGWMDEMSSYLDQLSTEDTRIAHAETLPSACVKEGYSAIIRAVREKSLTRIVLASCVCCPLNFVCSACTDQRSRLKNNLFHGTGISRSMVETCNLRGEILRLVENKPDLALIRFKGLLQRSIKRSAVLKPLPTVDRNYNFATAVIGTSQAANTSALTLADTDHDVFRFGTAEQPLKNPVEHANIHNFPDWNVKGISGTIGDFQILVESEGHQQIFRVGTVILGEKARRRIAYTHQEGLPNTTVEPVLQERGKKGVPFSYPCATSVPGLYLAEPSGINVSKLKKGTAAAIMVAATIPRGPRQSKGFTATVDEKLCRGCGRCINVCLYHAVTLTANEANGWHAYIDEALCKGCGNCLSVCPTGAADSPYRNRAYLEQALEEVLSRDSVHE